MFLVCGQSCCRSWPCSAPIRLPSARQPLPLHQHTPDVHRAPVQRPTKAGQISASPGDSTVIYPEKKPWAWQKAGPKDALKPLPQHGHAQSWVLNIIELIHWASFPVGFAVVYYMFANAATIATALPAGSGDAQARVFLAILGLLCQVFGGGISGNMMHMYEGWQVAPFENPVTLPANPSSQAVDKRRVQTHNNAWLRTVTYQMLFTFQSLGLLLFSAAVFGINNATTSLIALSTGIALLGPKEPRTDFMRYLPDPKDPSQTVARPYMPLSWSLLIVFGVAACLSLWASVKLFTPAFHNPITVAGHVLVLPNVVAPVLAVAGAALTAAGGAVEGYLAETSFNQWHHFVAFVILTVGLLVTGLSYKQLVTYAL